MIRARCAAWAIAIAIGILVTGCSNGDDDPELGEKTSTTTNAATAFDPPLPSGANQLPYVYGATVGLGTWKVRVTDTVDPYEGATAPSGQRYVALEMWAQNGALSDQALIDDVFLMYDDRSVGTPPLELDDRPLELALASVQEANFTLVFAIDAEATPRYLVFAGSETYGPKTLNGIFSLDPDFVPVAPD
jgi:hypothetical protein